MSSQDKDFAAAQIILASLLGDETLTVYDNPLQEIENLCQKIKEVVKNYQEGIPDDLPVKINEKVALEIYGITATKKWGKYINPVNHEIGSKEMRIEKILKRYNPGDKKYEDYVKVELSSAPDDFIDELEKLSTQDLKNRLDNWSDYELINVGDLIFERHNSRVR